ncbi:MAG TPA: HAMP domain-containing protein [Spirochaetota bacterium]|nr:HAMP domain-containing protein [Spirochaetota bacterium]HPJ33478.1 HAMP domain-containing protein [Spirochaetota bacterium]
MHINRGESSRLRRKLTLYFILISIVSISVSAEIIFEFSSGKLQREIGNNFIVNAEKHLPKGSVELMDRREVDNAVGRPIAVLRNRMILLLLVVFASIIGAFVMFTRDIVSPMHGIVEATKKIADGDLTITVPVMTNDEIGQIARLINDMNVNLQDLIMQIRQEISRHKKRIEEASHMISSIIGAGKAEEVIEKRRMKLSDYKKIASLSDDVVKQLDGMLTDLGALETFVRMYKTYAIRTEIEQSEIEKVLSDYEESSPYVDGE